MKHTIKEEKDGSYTFTVNLKFDGSMLEMEEQIAEMVNKLGISATLQALEQFDTDGESLEKGGQKLTSKGRKKKHSTRRTVADR